MQTDIARVFGLPSHVNKHGVTRQSKSVTRKNLKCMAKELRKCGFSGLTANRGTHIYFSGVYGYTSTNISVGRFNNI